MATTPPNTDSPLTHDISEHRRQPGLLPATPLDLAGLPPGGVLRTLRRLADGRLRSGLVDLPAGWRCDVPLRATGALQLFILDGLLEADGTTLGRYGYVVVPRGADLPYLASVATTRLVLILDADTQLVPAASGASGAQARVIADALTVIEPIVPVIAGRRLVGFERRVLWLDETSGADTRLLRIPAGFEGGGPGWHPVEEEILLLEGDVAPDDTRLLQPGDYLWNPARSVHGFHEHSRTGCLLLEWHDGPWAYNAWNAPGTISRR